MKIGRALDLIESGHLGINAYTAVVITDRQVPGLGIRRLSEIDTQGISDPYKHRPVILHLIFQHDPVFIGHPVIRAIRRIPGKTDRHFRECIFSIKINVRDLPRHGVHNMRVSPEHGPVALHD